MARKILVAAGASGIGKAIAAAFLAAGDDVYTCDINADALAAATIELPGLKTGACDIGNRGQIETMVADAAAQLGGIDVLVNNAGIAGPTAPVNDMDPDQWEQVLHMDLTGTFNVTRLAIPHLIASGNGVITIMSSAAGRFGYPNRSPYATATLGSHRLCEDALHGVGRVQYPGKRDPARRRRRRADPARIRRTR